MYSCEVILPSATYVRPFSQLAVSSGFRSWRIEQFTTSNIISPRSVGVITCVFLFNDKYLIETSFLRISALVALVPIPLPLICALSSSSSISWPAFSIARIIEPELYRLGGDVSPSLMFRASTVSISFFFSRCNAFKSCTSQDASSLSSLPDSCDLSAADFLAKEFVAYFRYPSSCSTLKPEKNFSFCISVTRLTFW